MSFECSRLIHHGNPRSILIELMSSGYNPTEACGRTFWWHTYWPQYVLLTYVLTSVRFGDRGWCRSETLSHSQPHTDCDSAKIGRRWVVWTRWTWMWAPHKLGDWAHSSSITPKPVLHRRIGVGKARWLTTASWLPEGMTSACGIRTNQWKGSGDGLPGSKESGTIYDR